MNSTGQGLGMGKGQPNAKDGDLPSVTVFIPAFNEERNIESAVEGAKKALQGRVARQEIILLNACSHDRTGEKKSRDDDCTQEDLSHCINLLE